MGLHIQNLSIRFDSMTREVLGNTECSKNGTDSTKNLCTTLFPVRTENEINLLNEKLRSDPQFRTDFVRIISVITRLSSHYS